jgi:hypothetical protein
MYYVPSSETPMYKSAWKTVMLSLGEFPEKILRTGGVKERRHTRASSKDAGGGGGECRGILDKKLAVEKTVKA